MKQLRLEFSDYSAAEQERDAERRRYLDKKYQPHAFLLRVDGVWAHMIFSDGKPFHKFYEGKTLIETFQELKEKHPLHKVKYIINKGLENYLRDVRKKELSVNKLQTMIDFNKGNTL